MSYVAGPGLVDPFASNTRQWPSFMHALLATAFFRCWHILLFFAAWSATVCLVNHYVHRLVVQPTMLTVLGTVLGFVISYRTTSSFERYNEGRRLWSQIVLNSRNFARLVWFHTPDVMPDISPKSESPDHHKARCIFEKKTMINLLEAFAVAVKHYLRGEEGIYYEDLYHLVKFLPSYALPAGMPSAGDLSELQALRSQSPYKHQPPSPTHPRQRVPSALSKDSLNGVTSRLQDSSGLRLPLPATSPVRSTHSIRSVAEVSEQKSSHEQDEDDTRNGDESLLKPARIPPKYGLFDVFPFSLLVHALTKSGKNIKGKKAARARARLTITHNLPLEISLYLSSYIAALSRRKVIDAPTSTAFNNSLTALVDALTGLERILTTPIPFSYSVHLWVVTVIYCFLLPFQILSTLNWLTIPATCIVAFIFFGFLAAGEEIENPFGYDKNDLNMDYFTHNIIRYELRAITAVPTPDPAVWAFSPANDHAFAHDSETQRVTPQGWIDRGVDEMRTALAVHLK